MAYFLYKYLKKRAARRKAGQTPDTAEPGSLMPDVPGAQHQKPAKTHNGLVQEGSATTASNSPQPVVDEQEAARVKAETTARRKHRWIMIVGLILPNFLAAADATIIAPAVPIISSHFNHLGSGFNWIVTAYTLTLTTFAPTSGQIADIYGRHAALQFHIFCIMIGSVFCSAANSWGMLLFGRALTGVGGAGIMLLTKVVLSDNVSLADNSKNNSIFSLVSGISYAIGPVIGGYLAQASWRYCFVVSIPVAFVSHLLIFFLMRKDLVKGSVYGSGYGGYARGLLTFDWIGTILFIFGVGLIILAVMWGGTEYAWSSAAFIAPITIGTILFILFWAHEFLLEPGRAFARTFKRTVAMIPWHLFSKHDTFHLMTINFASGAALYSAFYFISIYWEIAEGYSASKAGVQLLYYTPGLGVGVYTAMFLCNVWPAQTFTPLFFGSITECAGLAALIYAVSVRHRALVNGMIAIAGVGTGLRFMPLTLHVAGIWPTRLAACMSLMSFVFPFGGTIGISMMGSVFSNKFDEYVGKITPPSGRPAYNPHDLQNLTTIASLPAGVQEEIQNAGAQAVKWAFISIMPFMLLSIIAAALLGNVWIKKGGSGDKNKKGGVIYGSYLLALVKVCSLVDLV
ncbi:MFS general substrate transporter [Lophium mytilinum]|uniref:MFS general substrate transporter n=1 Tax=Lophium mytilinum TaxID=390894 RepID=A0A6A6QV21_9PEZI|nr:MFS general substrate transporter [Lophium mytilinum]